MRRRVSRGDVIAHEPAAHEIVDVEVRREHCATLVVRDDARDLERSSSCTNAEFRSPTDRITGSAS